MTQNHAMSRNGCFCPWCFERRELLSLKAGEFLCLECFRAVYVYRNFASHKDTLYTRRTPWGAAKE